jgi:hypothetical protein
MAKQKHSTPKRLFWIVWTAAWIVLAVGGPGAAEEKKTITSPGEAIGEAARRVTEDSKAAYHETRDAVAKSSREVVEGAKKAVQEAKGAGTQVVKDVKKGLNKEPASQP